MRFIKEGTLFDTEKARFIASQEVGAPHPYQPSNEDPAFILSLYVTAKGQHFMVSEALFGKRRQTIKLLYKADAAKFAEANAPVDVYLEFFRTEGSLEGRDG